MMKGLFLIGELCYLSVEWSRERLLESWMADPAACCDKAGVMAPDNLEDLPHEDHELDITKSLCSQGNITPNTPVSFHSKVICALYKSQWGSV